MECNQYLCVLVNHYIMCHSTNELISWQQLLQWLADLEQEGARIFILTDHNTHRYCLPVLLKKAPALQKAVVLRSVPGEDNKNIGASVSLWQSLSEKGADRQSVVLNLGGGMITDMGGFVAATFMRGIRFVNIPTSLLAMVDAASGGKVGVDLGPLKNQVGLFCPANFILLDSVFLNTLPLRQFLSGFAEMLKHALIADAAYFEQLLALDWSVPKMELALIKKSVVIKKQIVKNDPLERGLRKALNFGHTFGHAFEGYFLSQGGEPVFHGEAVVMGMICEAWLSVKMGHLPEDQLKTIVEALLKRFPYRDLPANNEDLLRLIQHDKKNKGNRVLLTLLLQVGRVQLDVEVQPSMLEAALDFYRSLKLQ